jgi:hypothetical protein
VRRRTGHDAIVEFHFEAGQIVGISADEALAMVVTPTT